MSKPTRMVTVLLSASVIGGCATDVQTRFKRIATNFQTTQAAAAQRISQINADPKWEPLWVHIPRNTASPTIEQLADQTHAEPSDTALLEAHHDALTSCRDNLVAGLEVVDARLADGLTQAYSENDQVVVAVAERKITWGAATQLAQQHTLAAKQELRRAEREINGELNQQNAAEVEHRVRIAQAIAIGLGAAAQAAQAARPITTTCNGGISYASCVTRQQTQGRYIKQLAEVYT